MALLLGVVLRFAAALFYGIALTLDRVADVAITLQIRVSWEFLVVGLCLIWYGRGGQLFLRETLSPARGWNSPAGLPGG